jgi:hypothetical protein
MLRKILQKWFEAQYDTYAMFLENLTFTEKMQTAGGTKHNLTSQYVSLE